ncbi:hypothetical protein JJD41_19850 [Oxynema sp. CENA135]|uniref:hypothetical protein n=1 Tax=Oxynema sp. CENA135 TaxID=984206 RepID=UPI001909A85D|nr:hypothetical protein [Oxynema sp. CENA135]MBK4732106.1 hypothetical protein [Oxynema sp. CENA135]
MSLKNKPFSGWTALGAGAIAPARVERAERGGVILLGRPDAIAAWQRSTPLWVCFWRSVPPPLSPTLFAFPAILLQI